MVRAALLDYHVDDRSTLCVAQLSTVSVQGTGAYSECSPTLDCLLQSHSRQLVAHLGRAHHGLVRQPRTRHPLLIGCYHPLRDYLHTAETSLRRHPRENNETTLFCFMRKKLKALV